MKLLILFPWSTKMDLAEEHVDEIWNGIRQQPFWELPPSGHNEHFVRPLMMNPLARYCPASNQRIPMKQNSSSSCTSGGREQRRRASQSANENPPSYWLWPTALDKRKRETSWESWGTYLIPRKGFASQFYLPKQDTYNWSITACLLKYSSATAVTSSTLALCFHSLKYIFKLEWMNSYLVKHLREFSKSRIEMRIHN